MKHICALAIGLILVLSAKAQQNPRQDINPAFYPFYHGVASGDPLQDRFIIWTRISPENTQAASFDVSWRVATDTGMTNIVQQGTVSTNAARDYTVKVDVSGLKPYTTYYYDFYALNKYSIRGRSRTTPIAAEANNLRLCVLSCSNYEYGYFNAYKMAVKRNDIDAVVHLGDYIYEYETGGYSANISDRNHQPENEIVSLQDYRVRYSHYRLDSDLQAIHQQYPFIVVWDDHESADNSYKDGANNHTEGAEGAWADRKVSSAQAFMEWMPIRESNGTSIYRTIKYGDLLNLYMIDTRIEGRDKQAQTGDLIAMNNQSRRLIGDTQFNWLVNEMKTSTAKWNVLGQQVMMAPLRAVAVPINTDQWDGYEFERSRLYAAINDNNVKNFVVLTGDIHTSWANDLPQLTYNPLTGSGSVGVEFVCSSVTSPGLDIPLGADVIKAGNLHVKYLDLQQKGYLVLNINNNEIQADWYYVTVDTPSETESYGAGYKCVSDSKHLVAASDKAADPNPPVVQAPAFPIGFAGTGIGASRELLVFGVYPNPFSESFFVQFYHQGSGETSIQLADGQGRIVYNKSFKQLNQGVNYLKIATNDLPAGVYNLLWLENGQISAKNLIKKDN